MPELKSKFKASKGSHTGLGRAMQYPKEIAKLEPGNVLVVQHTSPEWMEAFEFIRVNGGAIVTEVGGILCHAAITSREYKIPCVVAIDNARTKLNGKMVTVDATNGTVEYV